MTAGAAQARASTFERTGPQGQFLTYTAAAAETNAVTVGFNTANGGTYSFTDSAAVTVSSVTGTGCSGQGTNVVTCTGVGLVERISVILGDGNDSAAVDAAVPNSTGNNVFPTTIGLRGGDGNDSVTGSPVLRNELYGDDERVPAALAGDGDDRLTGGADDDLADGGGGSDDMSGAAGGGGSGDTVSYQWRSDAPLVIDADGAVEDDGADTTGDGVADERDTIGSGFENVRGGDLGDRIAGNGSRNVLDGRGGNDVLDAGAANDGADVFDGGSIGGLDTVTYARRTTSVAVDLTLSGGLGGEDANGDGSPEESDNIANVERVTGGSGADRLAGNAVANELSGGDGSDTLTGAGGQDVLRGEDGDDAVRARDGEADQIDCGAGGGDQAFTDLLDPPASAGCETVFGHDTDGDGTYDEEDSDDDNDGVDDGSDAFPLDGSRSSVPTGDDGTSGGAGLPSNAFSIGAVRVSTITGRAVLRVAVPGPGALSLVATANVHGSAAARGARTIQVARVTRAVTAAGPVRLVVKPSRTAMRWLARKRRLKTRVRVTYTPTGGIAGARTRTVTLRLTPR